MAAASIVLLLTGMTHGGSAHAAGDCNAAFSPDFPRLMGMNIGAKNYDDIFYQKRLSRMDVVILGFYPGWKKSYDWGGSSGIRAAVKAIKSYNPNVLVGQYTILNEAQDDISKNSANADKAKKLKQEDWWLRKADGEKTQWTHMYKAYDVNITPFARPDADGKRWPEWLAQRDYKQYFGPVPEFDIWYFDNVFAKPRIPVADWNGSGHDLSSNKEDVVTAYRAGHVAEWKRARSLRPDICLMGNVDHSLSAPQYRLQLQGAFLEGLMGKPYSIERRYGWKRMMSRYHNVMANTLKPKLVGFNVSGKTDDYRFFRYAFTSSLLDNGYFSYTDDAKGYSSVPWFDEYEFKLGQPLQGPQTQPWKKGVYRRVFEKGLVLVNPSSHIVSVQVGPDYRRITGTQAPDVNNGKVADQITLPARDGVVLEHISHS